MIELRPQPGPQEAFLSTSADLAGFGGAAGGGKTYALLLEAMRHTKNPKYGGVIFRRTRDDIRTEGALWDTSQQVYGGLAKSREANLDWTFPSGARISFEGIQYLKDIYTFQGAQIPFIGFDELTHFLEDQFWYMFSRNRSPSGVSGYCRFTLNPDPDSWVFNLLGPWVNPEHPHYGAKPGEIRWFKRESEEMIWLSEPPPERPKCRCLSLDCENCFPPEKSITYFPALVSDNEILLKTNPGYVASLKALGETEKARLLYGSWDAIESKDALDRII